MIIATAGHVDHGKTALVRALTGVDTDRLPEEKARGLTIDLGFAYHSLDDDHVLGFVDVPGHERFVRNMLAGVGAIDLALLVVAADDGVMPQTREHSAILDLLGVTECIAVVSKIDKVETARADAVSAEIDALLATTGMRGTAIHRASVVTGAGIDALSNTLRARTLAHALRSANGQFRLCVDRAFTLKGAGLVVTGAVYAGVARTGARLLVTPGGHEVRIRGIHAQDRPTEWARAGERCALNLSGRGLESGAITRGDWVVDRGLHATSDRIDVRLRILPDEPRALRHWTPVHVHLAASRSPARVAILDAGSIAPGGDGRVQVVFDRPLLALAGDRIIVRDPSATRTIGGGTIIDPVSPKRGRARLARRVWLDAIEEHDAEGAIARAVAATETGVDTDWIRRAFGVTEAEMERIHAVVGAVRVPDPKSDRWFSPAHWTDLQRAISTFLGEFHRRHPRMLGADPNQIRLGLPHRVSRSVVEHAIGGLLEIGAITRRGVTVRLPEHEVTLGPDDERLWPRIARLLDPAKGSPPSLRQAAEQLKIDEAKLGAFLKRAMQAGLVMPITRTRFVSLIAIGTLAAQAETLARVAPDGRFIASEYKDHTRIGRNFAIELLEFFDRSGFTERLGDRRRILRPAAEVFGAERSTTV